MVTQRAYRAACPNCGAPVDFASAASASAICGFCRSTLVRDGEALRRIGVSAELFDDHSPLQLGAAGRYQGMAFTLVGRLQIGYSAGARAPAAPAQGGSDAGGGIDGSWNEWHALFDSGRSGWLSEDNGAYVFAFDAPWPADAPESAQSLRAGQRVQIDGRGWTVASVVDAGLIAAQGELPRPPRLDGRWPIVEVRSTQDEVGSLEWSDAARPTWSIGRAVLLAELKLSGLKETSEKTLGGRAFECPGCGAPLEVKLATTRSISCLQCNTVVDVSQGIAGELEHFRQNNSGAGGLEPLIPLGSAGTLQLGTANAEPWQVVGYMERCDLPAPGSGDDQVFWREYLLYNRELGFAFLVDSEEDGWSWVRPITGTPAPAPGGRVTHRGITYAPRYTYRAKVTWVQGEFYWRVQRDEQAEVTDFAGTGKASASRLSREASGGEVVWSAGRSLDAAVVARAFGIAAGGEAAFRRDVSPIGADAASAAAKLSKGVVLMVMFIVLVIILSTCSDERCDDERRAFGENSAEYQQCVRRAGSSSRTSGGSWGGYSSGGGHK